MKKKELSFVEIMKRLKHAGIQDSPVPNRIATGWDELDSLDARIEKIFQIVRQPKRKAASMLFFVMYDIESNKVRNQIVKYLIKKGCFRIQQSIFLADLMPDDYQSIRSDLAEVQACYDNHDSILIVPISSDYLNSMKIIGKSINVDLITHRTNTLFF